MKHTTSISTPPVAKRKRLSKDDRARQLLDIAENLFISVGYELTTLEEVARIAGVTRPIVYEHYGSKEGLFLACARRARQEFEDAMVSAITSAESNDVSELIAKGGDVYFEILERNPDRWALLFSASVSDTSALSEALTELRGRTIERITELIERRLPSEVPRSTIEVCAYAISGIGEQLGRWWLRQSQVSRSTVVKHYTTFIVAGFQAMVLSSIENTELPKRRRKAKKT